MFRCGVRNAADLPNERMLTGESCTTIVKTLFVLAVPGISTDAYRTRNADPKTIPATPKAPARATSPSDTMSYYAHRNCNAYDTVLESR